MAKLKPPTDDELVRLLMRVEDASAGADDYARRITVHMSAPVELPIERASTLIVAASQMNKLAAALLLAAKLEENRVATKAMIEDRVAQETAASVSNG